MRWWNVWIEMGKVGFPFTSSRAQLLYAAVTAFSILALAAKVRRAWVTSFPHWMVGRGINWVELGRGCFTNMGISFYWDIACMCYCGIYSLSWFRISRWGRFAYPSMQVLRALQIPLRRAVFLIFVLCCLPTFASLLMVPALLCGVYWSGLSLFNVCDL